MMKRTLSSIGLCMASLALMFSAGCTVPPAVQPTPAPTNTLAEAPAAPPTPTSTRTQQATGTATTSPSPTAVKPLTLLFYGDSSLKVGEVGREGVGFSFVDDLPAKLAPGTILITANYGGKTTKWAYENIGQKVLNQHPDVVTLMWGWDDLQGCGGMFDRGSNTLVEPRLDALVKSSVNYLNLQIETLLNNGSAVFVVTPLPTNGNLPWTHMGPNNELVYELDNRCNYNLGIERLVEAQRQLVLGYTNAQKPVFMVDAWQIYRDNPNAEKMYMDIMHPASHGAELIAEGWLKAFNDSKVTQP